MNLHVKILRQGVVAWNGWRDANPEIKPDLRGADLRGADLRGADLSQPTPIPTPTVEDLATLAPSTLARNEAIAFGVKLTKADLRGADLRNADLSYADLSYADLRGADLRGANLGNADLRHADLRGADRMGAEMRGADMTYVNDGSEDNI